MTIMTRTFDDEMAQRSRKTPAQEQVSSPCEVLTHLDGGQHYVVCAFFTPGYRPHITRLKASLDRLGLNYHLREYPEQVTWEATTRFKPKFIADCMQQFPSFNILYVDADAIVRELPDFCDTVSSDVAILFSPVLHRHRRALSIAAGTLFIRNTPGGQRFVAAWNEQAAHVIPTTRDEDMIYMAFPALEGVSFTALPKAYSKIFDSPGPVPVIEHFQASRKAFKLRRWLRRLSRVGVLVGLLVVVTAIWLLSGIV